MHVLHQRPPLHELVTNCDQFRRYVGVVIEEDGKTEEEFIEEMLAMDQELNTLNNEARELEEIIHHNILELTGEG